MKLIKTQLINSTGTVFISLFFCMLPIRVLAANFSNVYTFGDSLVDNGNFYNKTLDPSFPGEPLPPSPPYYQGRFSNGPVWTEILESKLGLPASSGKNYAFGGATAGKNHVEYSPPSEFPGLLTQIDNFKKENQNADPNALYIVSAGANDYDEESLAAYDETSLATGNSSAAYRQIEETVGDLSQAVTTLSEEGAQTVMVVNLPNLGKIPGNVNRLSRSQQNFLTNFTQAHNRSLAESLQTLESRSDLNIVTLDLNSTLAEVTTNPNQFGLKNVTEPCINPPPNASICSNPDEYLFWDSFHPTAAGHQQIAESAYGEIEHVPEPFTVSGSLAALGLGVWLKRKYARN